MEKQTPHAEDNAQCDPLQPAQTREGPAESVADGRQPSVTCDTNLYHGFFALDSLCGLGQSSFNSSAVRQKVAKRFVWFSPRMGFAGSSDQAVEKLESLPPADENVVRRQSFYLCEGEMLPDRKPANLRTVAERVGLAPCSVSAILNNTPAAQAIPQATKDRVFRAAEELNYRPNLWARSLRTKRTRMVAAVTSDFGSGKVARVIEGLQGRLHRRGYLLVLGSLDYGDATCAQFQQRGIEGVIAIDATLLRQLDLPTACVDLDSMSSVDTLTDEMQMWLSELGASAAETIIRQVEQEDTARWMKVEPKFPPAHFGFLPAGMGAEIGTGESA